MADRRARARRGARRAARDAVLRSATAASACAARTRRAHAWPGTEQDAIYINGFFEIEDIHYAENAYGLARHNQFIVAVPNGKAMRWRIDGEAFDPATGRIEDYSRRLDFRSGLLTRAFVWVSPQRPARRP